MKYSFLIICIFAVLYTTAQPTSEVLRDTPIVYQKVIQVPEMDKDKIFERSLIWCGRAFVNSQYAIKTSNNESGIISGKALMKNYYKVPDKVKDSILSVGYGDYEFEWLLEIKNEKLRITIDRITALGIDQVEYSVTSGITSPIKFTFSSRERSDREWKMSKLYFFSKIEGLIAELTAFVNTKPTDF